MKEATIRSVASLEEYHACVRLQEEVWGEGFSEKVPVAVLMVSQRLGGIVAAAFDETGSPAGFVFGLTGWTGGQPIHWSDLLAVRPGLRGRGLGLRLKLFQRVQLLERGVHVAEWTFDPLESRNAYLNMGKLGAVAGEYVPNMYGTTGSQLHGGLPTDRFVVTWRLDSGRVRHRIAGADTLPAQEDVEDLPRAFDIVEEEGLPAPGGAPVRAADEGPVLVPIPADFAPIRSGRPALAERWRAVTREAFVELIGRGYEARELVRGGIVSHYLLVREEP